VGTDVVTGVQRYTFGSLQLGDGINLVVVTTGLFGIAEVIKNVGRVRPSSVSVGDVTWKTMLPTREDWRRAVFPAMRGTGVGAILGILPGTGAALSTFVAYAVEKRIARDPSRFGKGAIEGIAAPESANNAAAQTAFVPTLSLGIPGDAIVAIVLGALIIHGITPGPRLISENPELFWGVTVSFLIGNLMLLALNLPLIGVWVRILSIRYAILYPAILVFICVGVYSINNSVFDVIVAVVFGGIGYVMWLARFSPAPLLLGLVLGPILEQNLRRSLLLSRGDPMVFFERPISASILAVGAMLVVAMIFLSLRARRRARAPDRA
jgi:TctA family transporter